MSVYSHDTCCVCTCAAALKGHSVKAFVHVLHVELMHAATWTALNVKKNPLASIFPHHQHASHVAFASTNSNSSSVDQMLKQSAIHYEQNVFIITHNGYSLFAYLQQSYFIHFVVFCAQTLDFGTP